MKRSERELWKAIQRKVGAIDDGDPGPATANKIAGYLALEDVSPPQLDWPKDGNRTLIKHYGQPGSNMVRVVMPYTMSLSWDMDTKLSSFYCHKLVRKPLESIFQEALAHYGAEKIKALRLDRFGGCLNVRKKRGGTSWSTHAFGAAVDIDPSRNKLRWGRDRAQLAGRVYEPFWDIVEANGATSLGRTKNFDWMHFQFARA